MPNGHSKMTVDVGGRTLTFESGKIARQANGAVWVSQDETIVFATACASAEPKSDIDFLPLRIRGNQRTPRSSRRRPRYQRSPSRDQTSRR